MPPRPHLCRVYPVLRLRTWAELWKAHARQSPNVPEALGRCDCGGDGGSRTLVREPSVVEPTCVVASVYLVPGRRNSDLERHGTSPSDVSRLPPGQRVTASLCQSRPHHSAQATKCADGSAVIKRRERVPAFRQVLCSTLFDERHGRPARLTHTSTVHVETITSPALSKGKVVSEV